MDFFHGQESLVAIQWILRAVVIFFFMLFAAKLMGQRSISQLRLLDFVMALTIGNIVAHPLSDAKLGLKGSMITVSVLVILYIASVFVSLKSTKIRKLLDAPPIPIIENGQIIYKGLAKARISLDHLLSEARKEKIDDIQKVALALWESDGTISYFLKSQNQTVTREDLQLIPKGFALPKPVIKEGIIDFNELKQMGKDDIWLRNTIKTTHNVELNEILLATIDKNDQIKLFLYNR